MSINWDPGLFTIGIGDLDKQHAVFFKKIDELKIAYESGNENEEIVQIIDFLWEYSQYHFKYEEELMEELSFPGLEHQKLEHKSYIENYIKLREMLQDEGPTKKLMLYINTYVFKWLVEHISAEDKAFSAHINSRSSK